MLYSWWIRWILAHCALSIGLWFSLHSRLCCTSWGWSNIILLVKLVAKFQYISEGLLSLADPSFDIFSNEWFALIMNHHMVGNNLLCMSCRSHLSLPLFGALGVVPWSLTSDYALVSSPVTSSGLFSLFGKPGGSSSPSPSSSWGGICVGRSLDGHSISSCYAFHTWCRNYEVSRNGTWGQIYQHGIEIFRWKHSGDSIDQLIHTQTYSTLTSPSLLKSTSSKSPIIFPIWLIIRRVRNCIGVPFICIQKGIFFRSSSEWMGVHF